MVGNDYTIVDIAAWGWIDRANFVLGEGRLGEFPNISKWFASIDARPAVARARAIGKDLTFKRDLDEEARRALFPQNYVAA
jgi:GST-like protein